MQTIDSFLEYFEKVRGRTLRVVKCIPPEHIEWTYAAGKFTLGDLVRHLAAIERYMFVENACNRPSRYPGHGRELADGYDAVIAYLQRMHTESVAQLSRLSDDDMQKKCTNPDGTQITVWKWLRAMIEHEIHHRGQIYLYLSMLGVKTPPLYGLTEEEVRARSAAKAS
ncbi:MAG TPA: DinB family protein [Terriglobales bacterium]